MAKVNKSGMQAREIKANKSGMQAREIIDVKEESKKKKVIRFTVRWAIRGIGAVILFLSIAQYMQGLPLVFIVVASYMNLPLNAEPLSLDWTVWALSSIGVMVPLMLLIIAWVRYVWRYTIIDANKRVDTLVGFMSKSRKKNKDGKRARL